MGIVLFFLGIDGLGRKLWIRKAMDKKERDPQAFLLFVKVPDLLFNFFQLQVCWQFDSIAINSNHLLRMSDYLKREYFFVSKAFFAISRSPYRSWHENER